MPKTIKVNNESYEIYMGQSGQSCITYPKNICLQDSIDEMLEDIGVFDMEYLSEVYGDNASFCIT